MRFACNEKGDLMKHVRYQIFAFTLIMTFLLSACGAPTPVVIVVTATPAPITQAPSTSISPTASLAPVQTAGPQAGTKMLWIDGSALAYIPRSQFVMGKEDYYNAPVHSVMLDAYWIQTTKVTNRMYAQCVAVGACTPPTQQLGGPVYSNPEFANHPVVGVDWEQAQSYCVWAGGQLPTEAQWEKAARGENGNPYPWGVEDPACNILSFAYCNNTTSEVTAFKDGISPYGLYDMAGNVFEWVSDWYSDTYYNESPAENPTGPASGEYRAVRGSSFESYIDQIHLGVRHFNTPSNERRDIGFRCVVPNPQPYAPYCQTAAFIPSGIASSPTGCQLPTAEIAGRYCSTGDGFTTVDISFGAIYEADKDLNCTEAVVDGQRRLTCKGPRGVESTNELTICNAACSNSPDVTGAAPTCPPGYTLDAASGACNYTPLIGQVTAAGCPAGYELRDRGGAPTCVVSVDANGQCPVGAYFDSLAGMCLPVNGNADTPYGLDNPALASASYAGCAAGYSYSETFQCCQAVAGGTYPGCAPGTKFDSALGACSPGKVRLTGPGCITLDVTTIKCSEPVNVCASITNETRCIHVPQCKWDEQKGCQKRYP